MYIDSLMSGPSLISSAVLYSYSSGNSLGTLHFIWKVPDDISAEDLTKHNHECLRQIQPNLPLYHTRAMKKEFSSKVSLLKGMRPAVMRGIYRLLTGMQYMLYVKVLGLHVYFINFNVHDCTY